MTQIHQSASELADALVAHLGKKVVLGLPIGVGKAVHIVDALYERASSDPSVELTIFTGLTLSTPNAGTGLQARLLKPIIARLYPDWPTPKYVAAIANQSLPDNIQVREFYLRPGAYLGNDLAQQSYASINYSQVADELVALGVNVITQLIAPHREESGRYSLSSNPEITLDLLPRFEELRRRGNKVAMVGQVNARLPYMFGDSELKTDAFDFVLDSPELTFSLFGIPSKRVMPADYATGMHVASLVKDGGTLQLGIGSLSDAVAHCLRLRHESPAVFREVLDRLPGGPKSRRPPELPLETEAFEQGLYASTELLSDALLSLFECGLIARTADLDDETLIHAGFFVGSSDFYERLRQLPEEQRRRINMTRISFVNTLFGDEVRKRRQRRDARFVNETMMATLLGAAISDSLDEGRVISGVGGQFDFVSMAHSLDDAYSILMLRASRVSKGTSRSNIRWSYDHTTIPRHHRDIYVSEYGIAATRGKTDAQVIEAMLDIADSAFQQTLVGQAKKARKLAADYSLSGRARDNRAQVLEEVFGDPELQRYFPEYPLGTDLTPTEQELVVALEWLRQHSTGTFEKLRLLWSALCFGGPPIHKAGLDRLGLSKPASLSDRLQRRLVNYAMKASR